MAEVSFNIQGEYITELARAMFYQEERPYTAVEKLLLSCMWGTNIEEKVLKQYCEDILKFKRKFIGNTSDNSFCLVDDNGIIPNYIKTQNLDNYFFRLKNRDTESFYEYGFISPEGKFYAVEWGEHSEWANKYCEDNWTIDELMKTNNKGKYIGADYLVYIKGWLLLHNAHQGEAKLEQGKPMTKAQKETLYDYYINYGRDEEATKLYKEE